MVIPCFRKRFPRALVTGSFSREDKPAGTIAEAINGRRQLHIWPCERPRLGAAPCHPVQTGRGPGQCTTMADGTIFRINPGTVKPCFGVTPPQAVV